MIAVPNSIIPLLIIPILLSLVHILSFKSGKLLGRYTEYIRSFTAGFSVAYVFLLLMPDLPPLGLATKIDTALFALVGFTIFHEAHKLVFKQQDVKKRALLMDEVHLFTIGLYSFLVTFFLVEIVKQNYVQGILITFIIAFHLALSEISEEARRISINPSVRVTILVLTSLVGGILAILETLNASVSVALYSITAGAIIYIAIREEIPKRERGKPILFLIGVLIIVLAEQSIS